MTNDKNYTLRLQQGDKALFEVVFKDYYKKLCSYARGFLGDDDEAEDIVSDFFVFFWENRNELDISISLNAYFYTAIRNRCWNYIKHLSVRDKYKTIILSHYQEDLHIDKSENNSELDYQAQQKKIEEVLEKLPNQCKKVFMMSRYEEKKYEEIAEELNISRNAVKKHIVKALAIFRNSLKNEELFKVVLVMLLWPK